MSIKESWETSCKINPIGNKGAKSSGPIGSIVCGFNGGGSGFGNSGSHRTIDQSTYSSGTLHFRTKFTHVSTKDGTGTYTVTFTNNSVADNNFNGNLTFGL